MLAPSKNEPKTVVVLTGGPQGGKSTLLRRLSEDPELQGMLTVVPEAATLLFAGGHPTPSPSWGDLDWYHLELAVTSVQMSLEQSLARRTTLTVCDRAPFDNLAYPLGRQALELFWGPDLVSHMSRYDLVVHMESLATAGPQLFGQIRNDDRYETLAEARDLEGRARQAWAGHPNWHFVNGSRPFEEVLAEATALIKEHLTTMGAGDGEDAPG